MSKITRKKLARGTELVKEHVEVAYNAREEFKDGTIGNEQMETPYSEFSVNLNFPWLDSKYFHDNNEGKDPFYMSFCLPPVQEQMSKSRGADVNEDSNDTTVPILEEILFSFDQRDTRAATASYWYGKNKVAVSGSASGTSTATTQYQVNHLPVVSTVFSPNPYEGFLMYDRPESLNFRLSIYSKPQIYANSVVSTEVEAEVLNYEIPPEAFTAGFNPFVISGLHETFDPYKTYIVALFAPDLHDGRDAHQTTTEIPPPAVTSGGTTEYRFSQHAALISPWISLRFKAKTLSRKAASATSVQNAPTSTQSADGGDGGIAVIAKPADGDAIVADKQTANKGLQHGIQTVDQTLREKLRSGYGFHAQLDRYTQLQQQCGYEVISVPMMQGLMHNRLNPWEAWRSVPIAGPGASSITRGIKGGAYMDRRVIPIVGNMELHHVVACLNFTSDRIGLTGSAVVNMAPPVTADLSGQQGNYTKYGAAKFPGATTAGASLFKYQIGVALVTGLPGDTFNYQQMAYVEYDYAGGTGSNYLIDAVDLNLGAITPSDKHFEQALVSVPLLRGQDETGTGFWSNWGAKWQGTAAALPNSGVASKTLAGGNGQGVPFFIGGGTSRNAADPAAASADVPRSNVGRNLSSGVTIAPQTRGSESYIEIRMAVIPQIEVGIDSVTNTGDLIITTDAAHDLGVGEVIHIFNTVTTGATLNGVANLKLENNFWIVAAVPAADTLKVAAYKGSTTPVTVSGSMASVSSGVITRYGNPNNVVVGYGGNFVYLIGKKHLRG